MRLKSMLGWIAIIIISVVPVLLLFYLGPSSSTSYSDVTQKLGQIAALVGMTMFALNFILSTRIKFIEDIFGGLDKVYITHGILGGTALILILFHPILLVLKFIPSNFSLAASYLLPGAHWSVNFGIVAILGFIGLIYLTLYTKIKYNHWKFSHKFLGAVFALAVLHIFLVRGDASRDFIFSGYYIYATAVSVIGLGGFSYSLFIKERILQEAVYIIESLKQDNLAYEITLVPEGKPLTYKSGQFIFVRFYNEYLSKEAHPFSIASKSNDHKLKVVVKNLGDFTSGIHNLKVGDKVSIEGPYGRFNYDRRDGIDQVWIAGGVGITPFLGMAEDLKDRKINMKIDLYYSVKDDKDFISLNNLKEVANSNKNFRIIPWISNEKGRLTFGEIEKVSGKLQSKEFYMCGPSGFKDSIKDALINAGVSKDKIFEEEFNFI